MVGIRCGGKERLAGNKHHDELRGFVELLPVVLRRQLADVRAHLSGGEIRKLLRKRSGFYVEAGAPEGAALESLRFEPGRWSQGRGFYRWPTRWNLDWGPRGSRSIARLEIASRENIANWGVGAFGVAIVSGEIEHEGVKRSVYGLGQIVR